MKSSLFLDFTCNCSSGFSFSPMNPWTSILLHPASTRSALHFLCWFLPVPPGLGELAQCCCSCLEQVLLPGGSCGAAPGCAAKCCPWEVFFGMLTCCLCDSSPHKLGKPKGNVHLINSGQFCFCFY